MGKAGSLVSVGFDFQLNCLAAMWYWTTRLSSVGLWETGMAGKWHFFSLGAQIYSCFCSKNLLLLVCWWETWKLHPLPGLWLLGERQKVNCLLPTRAPSHTHSPFLQQIVVALAWQVREESCFLQWARKMQQDLSEKDSDKGLIHFTLCQKNIFSWQLERSKV